MTVMFFWKYRVWEKNEKLWECTWLCFQEQCSEIRKLSNRKKNPDKAMKFSIFKEIEKLASKVEENFMAVAWSQLWVHFHSRWDQEVQNHTFIPEGPVTGEFCCNDLAMRPKCNDRVEQGVQRNSKTHA